MLVCVLFCSTQVILETDISYVASVALPIIPSAGREMEAGEAFVGPDLQWHTSLQLIFLRLELSHMATTNFKRGWGMQSHRVPAQGEETDFCNQPQCLP